MAGKGSKKTSSERPVFLAASEELRAICSVLIDETTDWSGVSRRAMFGGILLYREQLPFAFLPRTRKMMEQDGFWLKFHTQSAARVRKLKADSRILDAGMQRASQGKNMPQWIGLLVAGSADVHHALRWLAEAHAAARVAAGGK